MMWCGLKADLMITTLWGANGLGRLLSILASHLTTGAPITTIIAAAVVVVIIVIIISFHPDIHP